MGLIRQGRIGFTAALAGIAALAVLASTPSADASTVAVAPDGKTMSVYYDAAPGEANRVRATSDGITITVRDPGATITPGNLCFAVSIHKAECTLGGVHFVRMTLGGGADTARVLGNVIGYFLGGKGADRLRGGPMLDFFDGGPGPDVMKGGASFDQVSYFSRTQGVRVTLSDGKRNEGGTIDGRRDLIAGIEQVIGSAGRDVIIGSNRDEAFHSISGRDLLRGGGGDDNLGDGDGRDRVFGGPGDDFFPQSDGRDRYFGNGGRDHIQLTNFTPNGADRADGGPGRDTIQLTMANNYVNLDGKANDGICADDPCTSSNEGDNMLNVEEIQASWGDDLLIGSFLNELFDPSVGDDIVRARGGDDTIDVAIDGDADIYNCGPGTDEIDGTPDAFDQNIDCE